jgi:hypothetical protein
MIAAAFGSQLTTKAMESVVRSCMIRTSSGEKLRRGKIKVTRMPGFSGAYATSSTAPRSVSCGRLVNHAGRLCNALRSAARRALARTLRVTQSDDGDLAKNLSETSASGGFVQCWALAGGYAARDPVALSVIGECATKAPDSLIGERCSLPILLPISGHAG